MIRSALMNVMTAAAIKAGRGLKRDFGEVENLQVSVKGPGDFVTAADKRAEKTLFEELSRARPGYSYGARQLAFCTWRWCSSIMRAANTNALLPWCRVAGKNCDSKSSAPPSATGPKSPSCALSIGLAASAGKAR